MPAAVDATPLSMGHYCVLGTSLPEMASTNRLGRKEQKRSTCSKLLQEAAADPSPE
jgi:hypothetical protein